MFGRQTAEEALASVGRILAPLVHADPGRLDARTIADRVATATAAKEAEIAQLLQRCLDEAAEATKFRGRCGELVAERDGLKAEIERLHEENGALLVTLQNRGRLLEKAEARIAELEGMHDRAQPVLEATRLWMLAKPASRASMGALLELQRASRAYHTEQPQKDGGTNA